jgi:bacillithiol biosynthesis cysteine-adding enzyme BshC
MHTVPFEELPGFSTLFQDFCHRRDAIMSRFPTNAALHDMQYWIERAAQRSQRGYNRDAIIAAVKQTMIGLELSPAQQDSLAALAEPSTFVVVTGQQAGLLGGALYTLFKAWSAVHTAQTLTAAWHNASSAESIGSAGGRLRAIPIFWVEDNDHDLAEVSTVGLLDRQGDVRELRLEWDVGEDWAANERSSVDISRGAPSYLVPSYLPKERTSISALCFDSAVYRLVNQMRAAFGLASSLDTQNETQGGQAEVSNHLSVQATEFSSEIMSLVEELYVEGASLAHAFTGVMQYFMAETGMLFVSAAALRKQGMFADVVCRELKQPEASDAALRTAEQVLKANGYHVQATASPLNLFYHANDGKRWKLNRIVERSTTEAEQFQAGEHLFTREDLLALAYSEPERFSPNVLLRPIAQDAALPTIVYIAGPGEVGYLAQLKELYAAFDVLPSAVVARHSATFLDARTSQFFEKRTAGFTFDRMAALLQPYHQLEQSVIKSVSTDTTAAALEQAHIATEHLYTELYKAIVGLDPTLGATVEKTKVQALQGLDGLAGKVRKAHKQQQEALLNKLRKVHALLYPLGVLQERALTPFSFVNRYGLPVLSAVLADLVQHEPDRHYIVPLAQR